MKYFSHYRAYVPTLLTLLHLINGVVLLHTVQTIGTQYIVIQLLFSIVLDGLDGYLAKRWGVMATGIFSHFRSKVIFCRITYDDRWSTGVSRIDPLTTSYS